MALKVANALVEPVLRPSWSGTGYTDTYVQTLKALRALDRPNSVDLSLWTFKNGPLTVFGFDLSPDKTDSSPCRWGITSLELRFSSPVPKDGLTAIVFSQFHGLMTIDKHRNVDTFDYIYKE